MRCWLMIVKSNGTSFSVIYRCSEYNNWSNGCRLSYSVFVDSKPCKQGIKRQNNYHKRVPAPLTALLLKMSELERVNSNKTAKLYLFEKGNRCFIGQVTCSSLREL
jgi:hypothetical protein